MFCVLPATAVFATGNKFKVRYKGGTSASNVRDSNWKNVLTINPDELVLETVDGQVIKIPTQKILSVNYSQKTTRHAATWIPLSVVTGSTALLWFMLDEKRKHFIGIRYSSGESDVSGVLIEVKNQDSKAFLYALETVTGTTIKNESMKPKKWYETSDS